MLTDRLQIVLETTGAGKVVSDFNKVSLAGKNLAGETAAAGSRLDGIAAKFGVSASTLKTGLAAGAVAVGAFAGKAVKDFTTLGQEILKFSRASGATIEESGLIVAALDDMGISADTGSRAIFQLAKRVESSGDKLAEFGLAVTREKDGSVDLAETLLRVSDRYRGINDPAKKAAFLAAAFGKQAQDLIPILEKGRAGIEDLFESARQSGQVLSPEQVRLAEDYRIAMDNLGDAVRKLSIGLGSVLTPVVTGIANALSSTIGDISKIAGAARDLGSEINKATGSNPKKGKEGIFDTLGDFYNTVIRGKDTVSDFAETTGTAGDAIEGFWGRMADVADVVAANEEVKESFDELMKTTLAAVDAQRAVEQASRNLEDARRDQADAQKDLNELLAKGAVDARDVADAERSLASARRGAGRAARDLADAQKEYDAALANANDLKGFDTAQDQLAEAADRLADAKDSAIDANEREQDAAEALHRAQAGDPDFQDKVAAARRRVKEATEGIADAEQTLGRRTYEAIQAHDAEREAIGLKADEAARLRSELEKLAALYPALTPFTNTLSAPLGGGTPSLPLESIGLKPPAPAPAGGSVTINQTFYTPMDADRVAREITWALTP